MAAPVVVVAAGGLPVTDLGAAGAAPFTVVSTYGVAVTLTAGALPVSLLNADGTFYAGGAYVPTYYFLGF